MARELMMDVVFLRAEWLSAGRVGGNSVSMVGLL